MKVASFIYKKNNRQVLGRYNRELVIRILVKRHLKHATCYHLVLTRRRSSANGRFDKLGYLQLVKEQKPLLVLGLNRKKILHQYYACFKNLLSSYNHFTHY